MGRDTLCSSYAWWDWWSQDSHLLFIALNISRIACVYVRMVFPLLFFKIFELNLKRLSINVFKYVLYAYGNIELIYHSFLICNSTYVMVIVSKVIANKRKQWNCSLPLYGSSCFILSYFLSTFQRRVNPMFDLMNINTHIYRICMHACLCVSGYFSYLSFLHNCFLIVQLIS